MQQRAIRADAVEVLLDFGCTRHLNSSGREIVYFDKAARTRFARTVPVAARNAKRLWRTYTA